VALPEEGVLRRPQARTRVVVNREKYTVQPSWDGVGVGAYSAGGGHGGYSRGAGVGPPRIPLTACARGSIWPGPGGAPSSLEQSVAGAARSLGEAEPELK
jgi:hypothetical protein